MKLICCDDDPIIRELLSSTLSDLAHDVKTVATGRDALAALDGSVKSNPEEQVCVILDLNMPEMSGWDVLEMIRQGKNTKHVPVIILSCQDGLEDLLNGYKLGADFYITKPFTKESLAQGLELVAKFNRKAESDKS